MREGGELSNMKPLMNLAAPEAPPARRVPSELEAQLYAVLEENDKLRERWTWQENEIERLTQICIILGLDPHRVDPETLARERAAQKQAEGCGICGGPCTHPESH